MDTLASNPTSGTAPAAPSVTTSPNFAKLTAELEKVLRLRSIPFGMELCPTVEEMQAVPRIRRPQAVHTLWPRRPAWAGRWA